MSPVSPPVPSIVVTWLGLLFDPFVPEWAGFVNANMKARNNSNIV